MTQYSPHLFYTIINRLTVPGFDSFLLLRFKRFISFVRLAEENRPPPGVKDDFFLFGFFSAFCQARKIRTLWSKIEKTQIK